MQPPEMTSDWKLRQGQAVWRGLAGELIVATNLNGDFVVEFSKPPITIASAQRSGEQWQVEFPAERKTLRGRGAGPSQIVWLHLAPALAGRTNAGWQLTMNNGGWRMKHRGGETLEGFLSP